MRTAGRMRAIVAVTLRHTLAGLLLAWSLAGCTSAEFARDAQSGMQHYQAGLAALERNDLRTAYGHFDMADFELGFAGRAYRWGAHYGTSAEAQLVVETTRAMARAQMGLIHLRQHDSAKAIDKFNAALQEGPLDSRRRALVLALRGTARLDAGDRAGAIADQRAATALDPGGEAVRQLRERLAR